MKTIKSRDIYGQEYDVPVNELNWRPAVYAIIVHDGQILLVSERNVYHMPGGGVNLGEMPEDAIIREVKEETGLAVTKPRLIGSLSTFFAQTHKKSLMQPSHVQSLLLYYVCDLTSSDVSLDQLELEDDEKEYGLTPSWVPLDTLDSIPVGSTVDWRPIVKRALRLAADQP